MQQFNFNIEMSAWQIVVGVIIIVAFSVLVVQRGIRAHHLKVAAGKEELVGRIAVAETVLGPKGIVFIEGEHWAAVSEGGVVKPEEEVTVTRVDGLKLYVSKKQ